MASVPTEGLPFPDARGGDSAVPVLRASGYCVLTLRGAVGVGEVLVQRCPGCPTLCKQLDTLRDASVFMSDDRPCGMAVHRGIHEVSPSTV